MSKKVLLTGASGALGRVLTTGLAEKGHAMILSDIADFPDALPQGSEFRKQDLSDKAAFDAMANEVSAIVHFGAVSIDRPFDEVLGPNFVGTYNIFELARAAKARVIFASSVHSIGFHERTTKLDENCDHRPDGYYGISKVYGEMFGRLYWDKHAVESLSIRIGSCVPKPTERRHLASWLSYPDLVGLVAAGLTAPDLGCRVVWGASNNKRRWWNSTRDAELGYQVKDNAEDYAAEVNNDSIGELAERYQGGIYTSNFGYSCETPSPADIFYWMKR